MNTMRAPIAHSEYHITSRIGWLRAAVLGANDGVVSTASLIVGIAAAGGDKHAVMLAGLAGLVAGAMSMAAGEFISVSSQVDAENADLSREARELRDDPEFERRELAGIYEKRGLAPTMALDVADALMAKDALGAHARDELGISEPLRARPLQAAASSAGAFSIGAGLSVLVALLAPADAMIVSTVVAALAFLGVLGGLGARASGANMTRPVLRVVFWGALAMAATATLGAAFGAGR
jgi:VIT1/CCC1 family predicted Fe2+/Mn2+ transporter